MATATRDLAVDFRRGIFLVAASAVVWSFGGAIARYIHVADSWTVIFWRAVFAGLFLLVFMLARDGLRGTVALVTGIGFAGLGVASCFALASTAFVVALAHTTVANILLMQAGAPLIAALLTRTLFGEQVSAATWGAIAAVIVGVGVMVSDSFAGKVSPIGDGLALLISFAVAAATVLTRRFAHVRMTPAVFLAQAISAAIAAVVVAPQWVEAGDLGLLFLFGAVNLGFGLALFVTGVRLVPAALAALVGTLEPVLGPVWVWLVHGEIPSDRTLLGGSLVFVALLVHLSVEWLLQSRRRPVVPSI